MPKVKISEYSATANSNTDVASINIDEGCAPSGINNAIRAIMGHLKDFQQGTNGDPFNGPVNGTLGATTASTANVTTLTTSSTVTHNGGTANGVAYLNGSKALTTGSALTFDGTNLGVGVSSPQSKLHIASVGADGTATARLQGNRGTDGQIGVLNFSNRLDISGGYIIGAVSVNRVGDDNTGEMLFSTAVGASTPTERMRLTSTGLGIGTSSPAAKLAVVGTGSIITATRADTNRADMTVTNNGGTVSFGINNSTGSWLTNGLAYYGYILGPTSASYGLQFGVGTANTAALTIDPSGNLLVGNTSRYSTEKASIYSASGTDVGLVVQNLGGSGNNGIRSIIATGGNNTSTAHFQGTTNGVNNWYLYGNGTTSYSSDARLKKNIETTRDGYIDDVMKLRVVKYNWKNSEDGTPKELGMIAQEIEEVFPNLVQDDLSPISDEDPIRYKQVKWSVLPFILLKALQEQQAIITQLTARITALEGA